MKISLLSLFKLPIFLFRKSLTLLLIGLPCCAMAQTGLKVFIKPDSVYQFSYPQEWKEKKGAADIEMKIPKGSGIILYEVKAFAQNLGAGYENATIREVATAEEKIAHEQELNGVVINYLTSSFEKINGKEWWCFEFSLVGSMFKSHTIQWKTVHNGKAYTYNYTGGEADFKKFYDQVRSSVNTFTFLKKDETVYNNATAPDKMTSSTASPTVAGSTNNGTGIPGGKDQGPVAQPGNIITSIPSANTAATTTTNDAVAIPVGSTEPTPEEIQAAEEKKEADIIKSCAPGAVKRKSKDLLEIKLGNGKTISLKNKDAGEETENYTFLDCIPSFNAYVLEVAGWETMSYLLLNKTDGTKTWLAQAPVLSPDKKRFVCASSGENDAGYDSNYLGIWSFANGKPKKELELSEMNWGAGEIIWLSNTSIKVEAEKYDGTNTKKLKSKIITLVSGKWVVK